MKLWSLGRNPRRPGAPGQSTTTTTPKSGRTTTLLQPTREAEVVLAPAAEAGAEDVVEESLTISSTKSRRHVAYGE